MTGLDRVRIVAVAVWVLAGPVATLGQASIASVQAEIRAVSAREFDVVVRFQLAEDLAAEEKLTHVGLLSPATEIHQVSAVDGGGAVPVDLVQSRSSVRWILEPSRRPLQSYGISYRVVTATGRIPLPSPEFAPTKPKSVRLQLVTPAGIEPSELFPRFEKAEQGWVAVLSNVPSFAVVANSSNAQSRILTAENISNLLILGLLGLFTWFWLRSRKKRNA